MSKRLFSLLCDWRLWLYNMVLVVYAPVLFFQKLRRLIVKKSDWEFDPLRWFFPKSTAQVSYEPSVKQQHVVFVSTGFGEMRVIEQLAQELHRQRPEVKTTWALRRRETLRIIQEEHPSQSVAFIPFDFILPVWSWLRSLSPDVVVVVEKMFLPNLVWCSVAWGAQVIVVNGRSGVRRGKFLKAIMQRWSLAGFNMICLQDEAELKKIHTALPSIVPVSITGSIKSDSPCVQRKPPSPELTQWANQKISPLLVAGSTHVGEEELVLDAFALVRQQAKCRLLIAPRHLHEVDKIITAVQKRQFRFSYRTEYSQPGAVSADAADVLILDTLGELADAYALAHAAYVGGTLQSTGHNIMEPLSCGVPVTFGPGKGEPTPMQTLALDAEVGFCVCNPSQLAECWVDILQNPQAKFEMAEKAKGLTENLYGATKANVSAILKLLDP